METITFEKLPAAISEIFAELKSIKALIVSQEFVTDPVLPKYVDINGAAKITSKTPNALRVQISLGNLKSVKKGSRHYFERQYLENWLSNDSVKRGI